LILRRVRESTGKVRDGLAPYERDGVVFDRAHPSYPLIACLLRVALASQGRLRVIDFGGSLGTTYFQCREFLSDVREIRWCVVEQQNFVECGKTEFENLELRFEASLECAMELQGADVILLSSVLPYVADPYALMERVCERGAPWILLDRTPFFRGGSDCITVQHVPASIYGAPVKYPARFFGRDSIDALLGRKYRKCSEFPGTVDAPVEVGGRVAEYLGQLWRRKT
jgi:putative methyltransferase (TIGR04325 family)